MNKIDAQPVPGSWSVRPFGDPDYCIPAVVAENGVEICICYGGGYPSPEVCMATAHLIKAAPDLLAACKLAASQSNGARDVDAYAEISWEAIDAIEAAIAKAGGGR